MKFIKILLIFNLAFSSCKNPEVKLRSTNEKELANKTNYSFLTDSLNLEQQLLEHNLAGFSLVIFQNYQIVYTGQWGLKSTNSNDKIDENTAFSTASISKPVTALLCHILEEKGFIDLDDPIDDYLKRWNLPKSPFTENIKPSWKHFLNHTAGTSQHGFSDFYEGDDIPTLKQSLLGQIPRYDKEIEFLFSPGTSWRYSGGGYVIVQMALEDYFNTTIAALAEEHIFKPLSMENTTMYQPNEMRFLTNVALVHDEENKVIRTGLPVTPQVAPSGLWSTPTDLAKLAMEIQMALNYKNNRIISQSVAKKITEVTAIKDAVGGWSYGWQRSFGFNNYDWFMHNGSNTGVGGDIFATMTHGNGFVFLANGEKQNRFPVIDNTRKKILTLLGWNQKMSNKQIKEIPLDLKETLTGTYDDFLYGQGFETKIIDRNNQLFVNSPFFEHFLGKEESKLVYLKNGSFKIIDYPNLLKFNLENGKIKSVILLRDHLSIEIPVQVK